MNKTLALIIAAVLVGIGIGYVVLNNVSLQEKNASYDVPTNEEILEYCPHIEEGFKERVSYKEIVDFEIEKTDFWAETKKWKGKETVVYGGLMHVIMTDSNGNEIKRNSGMQWAQVDEGWVLGDCIIPR